jgi:heme-degrading monooxygenase HmoA
MSDAGLEPALVDTIAVPDGNQEAVLAVFTDLFELLRGLDGFVEASLYKSVDGTRFLSYVQMHSDVHLHAAEAHSEVKEHLRALRRIGYPHVHRYEPVLQATPTRPPEPPDA